ncbi:winged helix-turn-helix transcriptional regulator [Planotetraspora kaengkrachanensis]|uniref:Transcriptional regulator n=1 Tax=Planotetraspora kaengkrachanensis TaxID=575193 RepID=A0A8J3V8L7_9ACTN|nr:helix-turn-helix domain-containing protein [Planotetraspora kaengkrachanensis]GIG81629.1 transcriptional regulator [Planotetraspora kaengkrachanensis]
MADARKGAASPTAEELDPCDVVRSILGRVGDKWSAVVMDELAAGPRRFNELRRLVSPITQRVLTSTLRALEGDGLVTRTVHPTIPPQVEYALTDSGRALHAIIKNVAAWTDAYLGTVHAARSARKDSAG